MEFSHIFVELFQEHRTNGDIYIKYITYLLHYVMWAMYIIDRYNYEWKLLSVCNRIFVHVNLFVIMHMNIIFQREISRLVILSNASKSAYLAILMLPGVESFSPKRKNNFIITKGQHSNPYWRKEIYFCE